ncbi:hypothetical protein EP7_001777 [Isosphaeraceae bacterium EP7]
MKALRGRVASSHFLTVGLGASIVLAVAALFCGDVLHHFSNWGFHDWEIFYFHNISIYRSIVEFREVPLWNPWCLGGMPLMANPQTPVPDPWFVLDLVFGPLVAIRLKIVAHYAVGLGGAYWCARQFRLSRISSIYFAGTLMFSTWLSLRIQAGHFCFLCAVYLPWVVGCLQLARTCPSRALVGSLLLTLMAFQGGVFVLIGAAALTGLLSLAWSVQDRSIRPLLSLGLLWTCFLGLAAVKLMPAYELVREVPRLSNIDPEGRTRDVVGGTMWTRYKSLLLGEGPAPIPETPAANQKASAELTNAASVGSGPRSIPSKWDMPSFVVRVFAGREQRSLQMYYPIQGFGWEEYGSYIGPLALILIAVSPFVLREAWPWMVAGACCFVIAAGNFAPFAPWTLLHRLPVLNSMRAPGRFLIPCTFAACMLASMVLDKLLSQKGTLVDADEEASPSTLQRRRRRYGLASLLVAIALVDSFMVGRHSLEGAFPEPRPPIASRLPSIMTVRRGERGQTAAMLANYCVLRADEALPIPIKVTPREDPDYRGELYFLPDRTGNGEGGDEVALLDWSPNSVTVEVKAASPGRVVLNRNWSRGWVVEGPFELSPHQGLISARMETGRHTIRFLYRPKIVRLGLLVSAVFILGVAVCLLRTRRGPAPVPSP